MPAKLTSGYLGLRSVLIVSIGTFATGTDAFIIAGLLPSIASDLRVSVALAGQMVTVFALAYAVGSPLVMSATASWRRRRVLVASMLLFAGANLVAAVSPNITVLAVSRIVAAVLAGLFVPSATVSVSMLVAPDKRGRALALVLGGTSFATVAGVPLGLAGRRRDELARSVRVRGRTLGRRCHRDRAAAATGTHSATHPGARPPHHARPSGHPQRARHHRRRQHRCVRGLHLPRLGVQRRRWGEDAARADPRLRDRGHGRRIPQRPRLRHVGPGQSVVGGPGGLHCQPGLASPRPHVVGRQPRLHGGLGSRRLGHRSAPAAQAGTSRRGRRGYRALAQRLRPSTSASASADSSAATSWTPPVPSVCGWWPPPAAYWRLFWCGFPRQRSELSPAGRRERYAMLDGVSLPMASSTGQFDGTLTASLTGPVRRR